MEKSLSLESETNFYHPLIVVMIYKGLHGDLRAISDLIDRTEGKPAQAIAIGTFGQFGDEFKQMSSRERWEFIERGNEMLAKYREEIGPGEIIDIPGESG